MDSCCSSVSLQKSAKTPDRSRSCDTVCTSNSSCVLQRRKPMNPLMYSVRPTYPKTTSNTVRQRVMSAKLLKLRSIQNQLNDANFHLNELSKENQTLKILQRRQDKALAKYENMNEDLPRLIRSHEEQIRVLNEKNKVLRKNLKELNDLVKVREEELLRANEKLSHLEKLNKDKHLLDREKLMEELEDYKLKLQKSEEQVTILNRKLMLENKSSKQKVNAEMVKHKEAQRTLGQALAEIDRLTGILETRETVAHPRRNRLSKANQRQSISMVTLSEYQPLAKKNSSTDKLKTIYDIEEDANKTPITDVKLEPIKCKQEDSAKKLNGIMKMPQESIKNRLSAKRRDSEDSLLNNQREHSSGSEASLDMRENSAGSSDSRTRPSFKLEKLSDKQLNNDLSRSDSNTKLETLSKSLDAAIQSAAKNSSDEFDRKLGEFCSNIVSNVRQSSERVDAHKSSLKISLEDTDTLLETFNKTTKIESKLRNSLLNIEDKERELINDILNEEIKFQTNKDERPIDRNGNITKREPRVTLEDKKKLLATFKAIDNGESIDSVSNSPQHRTHNTLMKKIFSDASER